MNVDLFLFDIAGTSVHDGGFVERAFRATARRVGAHVDAEWARVRMGLDKREVFRELATLAGRDATPVEEMSAIFERAIEAEIAAHPARALPGTEEAIEAMEQAGIAVGFTTGFARRTAELVLRPLGWPVKLLVASDEVSRGRPAPEMIFECMRRAGVTDASRVGVAGDTPADLGAGTHARCRYVVGVGCGSHTLEELAKHPHTHLMNDLRGLAEVLHATV